jgi:hypothetical protein
MNAIEEDAAAAEPGSICLGERRCSLAGSYALPDR